jgi:hypothetical protein
MATTMVKSPRGTKTFSRVHQDWLDWNARQSCPLPVCPKCNLPFDERDHGDLFPAWCSTCETSLAFRYIWRMIRRFGRDGALIKLRALARVAAK